MSGPPKGTFVPISPVRSPPAVSPPSSTDSDDEHVVGKILCVGMCVMDLIHLVATYPEEDSDKRSIDGYMQRGGNASNNCSVLVQLGASVEFLGMMTKNAAFMYLPLDCQKRGISTQHCPTTDEEPPFSSIILSADTGTRTISHAPRKFPILTYDHFSKIDLNGGYAWMHFEGRNADETSRMLRDVYARNSTKSDKIRLSLDLEQPCPGNLELAEFVDYVFLGKDFAQFCGWGNARTAVFGLRERIAKLCKVANHKPNIICPWGSCGVVCLDSADRFSSLSAVPDVKVVDSLGAGDTFCAATIFALSHLNMDLKGAVAYGNQVAGYKVTKRGYDDIAKAFRGKGFMT